MDKKNFGLTKDKFNELRQGLLKGDDSLFEKIFLSHFEDCMAYLKSNFSINNEEAYDVSMDTLLEFRKYLISGKIDYGNLRFLFTRMASQRLFKVKKKDAKIDFQEKLPETIDMEQKFDDEDLLVLNKAWAKLSEKCKTLLKQFYYENQKLSDIALNIGVNAATLRKQKERCVNSLREKFQV